MPANYRTALRAVTYENTSDNPSGLTRTVSFAVNDGDDPSNIETRDITPAAVDDAPTITNLAGDGLAYTEGDGAVVVEQGADAIVNDVDSADFDTGNLTVSIAAGGDAAEDVLSIRDQGMGAGQVGFSGGNVFYGGTLIGTAAGGSDGADLVVTFNASATPGAVTALVKNITYENTDEDDPTAGTRTVRFTVNDGDGGTTPQTINVTVANANEAPVTPTDNANTDLSAPVPIPPDTSPEQTDTSVLIDVATVKTPMPDEASSDAEQSGLLESLPSTGSGFTTNRDANETPPDSSSADSDNADSTAIASTEDPIESPAELERVSESSRPNILERVLQSIPVGKSEIAFHDSEAGLRAFWNALDTAREMIENAGTSAAAREKLVSRIETGASVALTAGFLTLGFRGESLLAALLSSLPAWRRFDPMAVLAMSPTDRKKLMKRLEEDDEEIRNVLALEDD
jgi:hypothetical protein